MLLDQIRLESIIESVEKRQMEDSEYFALDAINNSKLKLINPNEGGSPLQFFTGSKGEHSSSMDLGSATHQLLLEKEKYFLSDFEKPGGKVGKIFETVHNLMTKSFGFLDFNSALEASCKLHDYYSNSLTEKRIETLKEKGLPYLNYLEKEYKPGIIVLTTDQRSKCIQCVKSIKNNKHSSDLLYPDTTIGNIKTFNEDVILVNIRGILLDSIFGLDDEIILKMKCKIDNWSVDLEKNIITLNDLKTTGKLLGSFPEGSFQHYHYYRQAAFYGWVLLQYCNKEYGKRNWTMNVNMIVVETFGLYTSQVFRVGESWIKKGFEEFKDLVKRVVFHTIRGSDKMLEYNEPLSFIIE